MCEKNKKNVEIGCVGSSTSSLVKHYKMKHPKEYAVAITENEKKTVIQPTILTSLDSYTVLRHMPAATLLHFQCHVHSAVLRWLFSKRIGWN